MMAKSLMLMWLIILFSHDVSLSIVTTEVFLWTNICLYSIIINDEEGNCNR